MSLNWVLSASSDDTHPDQEVDLAPLGNPGGGVWAYVASETGGWVWGVQSAWIWDDGDLIKGGVALNEGDAKRAVEGWIEEQQH